MQAALAGNLPGLVEIQQLQARAARGSNWSDGKLTIEEMAVAARRTRKENPGDHGPLRQPGSGGRIESRGPAQATPGDRPGSKPAGRFRYASCRDAGAQIRADGSLDYPDEVLARLDIVIASLHVSLRQPRAQVTERLINAIRNPHVDIIGHPTGCMIPNREGADLDMDAVLAVAAESQTALEINAYPVRLDLDDVMARRAIQMGIKLSINTDAHSAEDLDLLHFGVATGRERWVRTDDVINTLEPERLLRWLEGRDCPISNLQKPGTQLPGRVMKIKSWLLHLFYISLVLILSCSNAIPALANQQQAAQFSAYDVINAVNQIRESNGLPPYQINGSLMAAAQAHSDYQALIREVTHTGQGGSNAKSRAVAAGYGGGAWPCSCPRISTAVGMPPLNRR